MEQADGARRTLFEPEVQPVEATSVAPPIVVPVVAEAAASDDEPEEELPPRGFNPWLAVLWVLGLLLLAAGMLTNWQIYQQSMVDDPLFDGEAYWAVVSVTQMFTPWFVGVGLAAIACAVLIHALDWRERHP